MQLKRYLTPALLGAALLGACADDPTSAPAVTPEPAHALGLVEIRVTGIGTSRMSATVSPVGASASGGARMDLTPVPGGSPAGSIQMERISATTVDVGTRGAGGQRYIQAVFQVRNADASGNTYGTARQNLTFVPVGISSTISGTPVKTFLKQDGTAAQTSLAGDLVPTGAVALDGGGALVSQYPDVMQAYTETEIDAVTMPAAVSNKLPYGFVVRHVTDASSRTLPANPAVGQFDGRVTFAYRIPLAATSAEDPFTISIVAVAMDDPTTRVTQSVEEQTEAGQSAFESRVSSLNAQQVTLLPGGGYFGDVPKQTVCGIRVSGTRGSPDQTLAACPVAVGPMDVVCHARVADNSVSCDSSDVALLAPTNVSVAGGVLQFDMTIQNRLTQQAMGTMDGVTTDTGGVALVFGSAPSVTGGTGSVSASNTNGTRSGKAAFVYSGVLAPNAVSPSRQWRFDVTGGVARFDFIVTVTTEVQRRIVISELMPNPGGTVQDSVGEYVELYNAGRFATNLKGFILRDNTAGVADTIKTDLVVAAGGYTLLGRSADTSKNGGITPNYLYTSRVGTTSTSITFSNSGSDFFVVKAPAGVTMDSVFYTSGTTTAVAGVAREVKNLTADNLLADGTNWGAATAVYDATNNNRGTPRLPNSVAP